MHMSIYHVYTKKCPKCGYVLSQLADRFDDYAYERIKLGKIYRKCPQCSFVYRDRDTYDLAIMDLPYYYTSFFTGRTLLCVVWCVLMISVLSSSLERGFDWSDIMFFFLGVAPMAGHIYKIIKRRKAVRYEKSICIKRLEDDPEYQMMILSDGYKLPSSIHYKNKSK